MRIAVTGGNGKLGTATVGVLREAGHEVIVLDAAGADRSAFTRVDLTDLGQTMDALAGIDERNGGLDAVAHLAAIPAPGILSDAGTFHHNLTATFNVFQACRRLGIRRIAYASSETVLGLPFQTPPPYVPLDEEYDTRPESMYSLVKHLEEELAGKLVRWDAELSISALRFSNVMAVEDYARFPSFDADPAQRAWNLWGYIDARDGGHAVRLALETALPGFEAYNVFAADTVMTRDSASLLAERFPGVEVRAELGEHQSLTSTAKAERMLGWRAAHSWRDHV
ncbi:MAG TPA: NAD(P)-dependent oxidoreductase [Rhodoglobus sp.]|nr:NAD(P)-dependent oxidoreductase [Rhodoglobus sp.]